jgi:PAS domain S-box-containing protein
MFDLFSAFSVSQSGVPTLTFCTLIVMSANRKFKTIFAMTWETLGGILGSVVAVGALTKSTWNYACVMRKKREDRKREDDENRDTLKNFPEAMRRFSEATLKIEEIGKGVESNTLMLETVSKQINGVRKDQDYYRQLKEIELEDAGVCWFECDKDGRTMAVSQNLCSLFGLTEDQMLKDGSGWLTVIEEQDFVYKQWINAVTQHLPYRCTYMVRRKSGETFYVEASAVRIEYDGETYRYRGVVRKLDGVK